MNLSGNVYRASAGETADSIAYRLFGHEKYAAELLCCNPEIDGKILMTGGERILIPIIDLPKAEGTAMPETAPWKE